MSNPVEKLRRTITNLDGVSADVQRLLTQAEDALIVLEDREARRSARNRTSDPRERIAG